MSDSLENTAAELVYAVDLREKDETDAKNYADWSVEVERAVTRQIETIDKRGKVICRAYPEEGPPYVELEKNLFEQELKTVQKKVERKLIVNQRLIDKLIEEINNNFGYQGSAIETEWDAFKQMMDQVPPDEQAPIYSPDYDELSDPYQVIIDPYGFGLDEKPYGLKAIQYTYQKALERGDYYVLLGRGGGRFFRKELIPNFEEMRDKAFKQALNDPDAFDALYYLVEFQEVQSRSYPFGPPKLEGALPGYHTKKRVEYMNSDETNHLSSIFVGELRKLCERAASQEPSRFLTFDGLRYFDHLPLFSEIVKIAFRNINLQYRSAFLKDLHPYLDESIVRALAEETVRELLTVDPDHMFKSYKHFKDFVDKPERWLERCIEITPELAIFNYNDFKDLPEAREWVEWGCSKLLETNYTKALLLYDHYHDSVPFPYYFENDLIEVGLKKYPDFLLDPDICGHSIQKRSDWPEIKAKAEKRGAYFKAKRDEALEVMLASIPKEMKYKYWGITEGRLTEAFLQDPAIALYPLVDSAWLEPYVKPKEVQVEITIIVLRNMVRRNMSLNKENFLDAYSELWAAEEKYRNVPLFEGRNILLLSHSETYKDVEHLQRLPDKDRFGGKRFVDKLQEKQGSGKKFAHIEAKKKDFESIRKAKETALHAIEEFPSPMTFCFDGHAYENAIYLSDGDIAGTSLGLKGAKQAEPVETENTVKITTVELAEAILKRYRNKKDIEKDIFIFDGCKTFAFIQNLYKQLENLNCPKPIAISPAEYGQYSFSRYESAYGSDFWDAILKQAKPTMGDFFYFEKVNFHNPSVFIPDLYGSMQIAEAESDGEEKSKAA